MTVLWGRADDGSAVQVTVPDGATEVLEERWPPIGLQVSNGSNGPVVRQVDVHAIGTDGQVQATVDGEVSQGGWDKVESELALFAAERLDGLVAVHAAVIVGGGKALVLPGSSGAGKSTLCVAAAAAGCTVLSDEYALVEPTSGKVTGWRRPVRVRRAGGGVDRLDLAVDSDPVAVGLVALVTYEAGAENVWAPIGAADAVVGLLANTVCASSRPDESLDAALAISRSALAVAGSRGEAAGAVAELLALLDR